MRSTAHTLLRITSNDEIKDTIIQDSTGSLVTIEDGISVNIQEERAIKSKMAQIQYTYRGSNLARVAMDSSSASNPEPFNDVRRFGSVVLENSLVLGPGRTGKDKSDALDLKSIVFDLKSFDFALVIIFL